jgi:hypothetical protein
MSRVGLSTLVGVVVALLATPAAAGPGQVLVGGLFNPRGLDVGPSGRLLVAESGAGAITEIRQRRNRPPGVSRFASLPAVPDQSLGPVDVARSGNGAAYVVMSGPPETTTTPFGRLLRVRRNGNVQPIADIAAYQRGDPDPDDLEDVPEESNPNGLALLGGGKVLVADAAGNDLLLVDGRGRITTVARFKPELVPWPPGLPFGPPAGTPVPAESVPTAIAIGPDGAWYVSELKGFPFAKGSSRIWRIRPGSAGATCDPVHPNTGPCRTVAKGFSSVIDLAFGENRTMYVLEIAKEGLVDVEVRGNPPIGALWAVRHGNKRELAAGTLLFPGGVAVADEHDEDDDDRHGFHHDDDTTLYVTTGAVFGPGAGAVVRIRD